MHNKKRNSLIVYEQLMRKIASCLMEENHTLAKKYYKIIQEFYYSDNEIQKEYKLALALANKDCSEFVAKRILDESRKKVKFQSSSSLNQEKTMLIQKIRALGDQDFFNQPIKEYKAYATIQVLLNDWREDSCEIDRITNYEGKLYNRLLESDTNKNDDQDIKIDEDVSNLAVKLMSEKFEIKWAEKLSIDQRQILKDYISGQVDTKKLQALKESTLQEIEKLKKTSSNEALSQLNDVKKFLLETKTDVLDDETILQFMQIAELKNEIEKGGIL